MIEPRKAAVFICQAHGIDPVSTRTIMKDPRVGHVEILPSCCSPEGLDQIQLHLRGGSTQALLVLGCRSEYLGRYEEMARGAGLPSNRVAVVPAVACQTANASELALARVLDVREPTFPLERKDHGLLLIGEGASAEAALEQARTEGPTVRHLSNREIEGESRLLGGPGRFILEAGESLYEFGTALLIIDQKVSVQRDRLCERPGTLVALAGGEVCADAFLHEVRKGLEGGEKVYAAAQETPFSGSRELEYRALQERGATFLRASEVEVTTDGALLWDEHLGETVLLQVGSLVTVTSCRPGMADHLLSLFGLPAGWQARELGPGESGAPGVLLGGSAFTTFSGVEAVRAARAAVVHIASEMKRTTAQVPLARVEPSKCSLCLTCLRLCPYRAPFLEEGKMKISLERCRGCGMCLSLCPSHAIEMPPTDLRGEIDGTSMGEGGDGR